MSDPTSVNVVAVVQDGIRLLNHSGFHQLDDVIVGADLTGDTAVIRPLHIGQLTVSYLIGEKDSYRNIEQETLAAFQQKLADTFDDEEVRQLCFELGIRYEDYLTDAAHNGRIRQLVDYARRHGRLAEITTYCRRQRPRITWPDFPITDPAAIVNKADLAVVVSLARPALEDAAQYLAAQQIDANFVLISNVPAYNENRFLKLDQDWNQVAYEFSRTMDKMARQLAGTRKHFFLAAPLPVAFALGCIWGTVHTGDKLYHLDRDTEQYVHVMTTSQAWLSQ